MTDDPYRGNAPPPPRPPINAATVAANIGTIIARANGRMPERPLSNYGQEAARQLAVELALASLFDKDDLSAIADQAREIVRQHGSRLVWHTPGQSTPRKPRPGRRPKPTREGEAFEALGELDQMAGDPRRGGLPSKTQVRTGAQDARRVRIRSDQSRARHDARQTRRQRALVAAQGQIRPFIVIPPQLDLPAEINNKILQYASSAMGQVIIGAFEKGSDPREAMNAKVIEDALRALNGQLGGRIPAAAIKVIAQGSAALLAQSDVVSGIIALKAVVDMIRSVEGRGKGERFDGEPESGWVVAARRLQGAAPRPRSAPSAPSRSTASTSGRSAAALIEVRRQLGREAAPAFAAAIDRAVSPELVTRFAQTHPAGFDVAKLRHAYVVTAARHFAAEFGRTIGSIPAGTSSNLALGAIIATALAHAGKQFKLIPTAATPAMSVLIHKLLQPRLPVLARIAATIAPAPERHVPAASRPMIRELAW